MKRYSNNNDKKEVEPSYPIKIVLIGAKGTGKTMLLKRYVNGYLRE